MQFKFDQIRTIHMELTTRCNAACPQCPRNLSGDRPNPIIPISDISFDQAKTILLPIVHQLHGFYVCGNFGDPAIAKDSLEILTWIRDTNPKITLGLHTNGSIRTPEWWAKLGKILNKPGDKVHWGIDGLEDTNHIYRRHTVWSKIMENAEAYITAGGCAFWDYIVFEHNEHQIEQARQLASEMGFFKFSAKKTKRFIDQETLEVTETTPVIDRNGDEIYKLKMPSDQKWRNSTFEKRSEIIEQFNSIDSYLDTCDIDCKVLKDQSIYISAEGLVFPCCWTAASIYGNTTDRMQILDLLDHNTSNVSALNHGIQPIVNGEYFQRIEQSWQSTSIADGRLHVCSRICGKDFDQYGQQWQST